MRNPTLLGCVALGLFTPVAAANGGEDDLGRVNVPALKNVSVTAKPGEGFTLDAGDEFRLNMYNRIEAQWRFSALDNANADVHTIRMKRVRSRFRGHAFSPKTQFQLQLEWATGGANLLDAWIKQEIWENDQWALTVRGGTQKTHYGREATGNVGFLAFTERSLAARTFSTNRLAGALVELSGKESMLKAYAGIWNGDTAAGNLLGSAQNGANSDNEMSYSFGARYDFNEDLGDLDFEQADLARREEWAGQVGANIWIGNERVGGNDVDVLAFNVNGVFKVQGFSALAEFFFHGSEPDTPGSQANDNNGWNIQGTYTLENNWSFGGRVSGVSIDNSGARGIAPASSGAAGGGTALATTGDIIEFSVGASRYFNGHHRKIQADITFQSLDNDSAGVQDDDNIIFRILAVLGI